MEDILDNIKSYQFTPSFNDIGQIFWDDFDVWLLINQYLYLLIYYFLIATLLDLYVLSIDPFFTFSLLIPHSRCTVLDQSAKKGLLAKGS